MHEIDIIIDQFVQKVNQSKVISEPLQENEITNKLKQKEDEYGYYWKILRDDSINWIEDLEAKLPAKFPSSFRSLITRYIFPAFEIEPFFLFANTREKTYWELRDITFRDHHMSEILLKNGCIQFGEP
ncbi:MAG: hypothetical protein QXL17_05880 [Candidatus Thermoplasmatota archaeon]